MSTLADFPPNPVIFLDASNIDDENNALVSHGIDVSTWANQGSFNADFVADETSVPTSPNISKPYLKKSATEAAVNFDGVTDFLTCPGSATACADIHRTAIFDLMFCLRRRGGLVNTGAEKTLFGGAINGVGLSIYIDETAHTLHIRLNNGAIFNADFVTRFDVGNLPLGQPVFILVRGTGTSIKVTQDFYNWQTVALTGSLGTAAAAQYDYSIGSVSPSAGIISHGPYEGDVFKAALWLPATAGGLATTNQLVAAKAAWMADVGTAVTPIIAWVGDSETNGATDVEQHPWPTRMDNDEELYPQVGSANYGKGGDTIPQMQARKQYFLGQGHAGFGLWGGINDIIADATGATTLGHYQDLLADMLADTTGYVFANTGATFAAYSGWSAPRQAQYDILRAGIVALASHPSGRVVVIDGYTAYLPPDYPDGLHFALLGVERIVVVNVPPVLAKFPAETPTVETEVNTFGITADFVRRRFYPQSPSFNTDSNPTEDTVTEFVEDAAADLEAALLQEDIDPASLIATNKAAYIWCRKTIALDAAITCYPVMTGQDPAVLQKWQLKLNARYEDLAEKGYLALGGGVAAPAEQPDGPTHFIDRLNLDTSENDRRASSVDMPFHKDDQL